MQLLLERFDIGAFRKNNKLDDRQLDKTAAKKLSFESMISVLFLGTRPVNSKCKGGKNYVS